MFAMYSKGGSSSFHEASCATELEVDAWVMRSQHRYSFGGTVNWRQAALARSSMRASQALFTKICSTFTRSAIHVSSSAEILYEGE